MSILDFKINSSFQSLNTESNENLPGNTGLPKTPNDLFAIQKQIAQRNTLTHPHTPGTSQVIEIAPTNTPGTSQVIEIAPTNTQNTCPQTNPQTNPPSNQTNQGNRGQPSETPGNGTTYNNIPPSRKQDVW